MYLLDNIHYIEIDRIVDSQAPFPSKFNCVYGLLPTAGFLNAENLTHWT